MIRKLFAGVSVAAVAVAAVLLMTVGSSANAKPAEATVADIGWTVQSIASNTFAHIQVNAQDDFWDNPNNSLWDLDITAGAGEFLELDPTGGAPGCVDQNGPFSRCDVNSNGFGQSNTFAPQGGPTPDGTVNTSTFTDSLSILNSFATGTTHIQVCNLHSGAAGDAWVSPDPAAYCNNNTSHVEAWWQAPPGFAGGTVTFCATQTNTVCENLTVVGPIASVELFAFRHESTENSICTDTPVYVIGAAGFNQGNWGTSFDNDRAILCVVAKDSNGTRVTDPNQIITWSTTDGSLATNATHLGASVNASLNSLSSGASGQSGDVATVTASVNGKSDTVEIAFGGDPATCTVADVEDVLDIGDSAEFVATFYDAQGNIVPDGIIAHLVEVDSGDGADNVELVSVTEDTVNGVVSGNIIGAISGLTTVAASLEHIAGADPTCSEAIELSGDVHVHPDACEEDEDFILYGNQPPAGGGFGTFAFCGGSWEALLDASGCPEATAVFFYNTPAGGFEVWIPGSDVAAVNAEILERWPNQHNPIPHGTIFTAKCK